MTLKRALLASFAIALVVVAAVFWFHLVRSGVALDEGDEEDKPIAVPERVSTIDGQRVITLDNPAQVQSGIVTAHPQAARAPRRASIAGRVLDTSELADLYRRYRRARPGAPELAAAVQRTVAQRYGAAFADALAQPGGTFVDSFGGKAVLIEIAFPSAGAPPAALPARDIRGRRLSLSRLAAATRPQHWFYRAGAGADLAAGDTVTVDLPAASARPGVTVPAAAVVWHDGVPWVYVRRAEYRFARVSLAGAAPRADGGYGTVALTPNDEIVVQGAELLLSEEFRARIQTEG